MLRDLPPYSFVSVAPLCMNSFSSIQIMVINILSIWGGRVVDLGFMLTYLFVEFSPISSALVSHY